MLLKKINLLISRDYRFDREFDEYRKRKRESSLLGNKHIALRRTPDGGPNLHKHYLAQFLQ